MSLEAAIRFVPVYVLVLFRVGGMMAMAPLLGSARVPRPVKAMVAIVTALALTTSTKPPQRLPDTPWGLALGIGGEIIFGVAMGMILTFIFVASQWAGEIIGQQMGLNLGEVFDPSFGGQSSVAGDFYFMLTLVIFLAIDGHHALIRGVHASLDALPLLSFSMDQSLFDLLIKLFEGASVLALRLAAPVLVTMLVVDLTMGFVGKTMPQINLMSAGTSLRGIVAVIVLIFGLGLSSDVIRTAMSDSMRTVFMQWSTPR